jgi:DNA ligase 1
MAKFQALKAASPSLTEEELETLTYPMIVSPKLDGIRCIVKQGTAYTKSGKHVPNAWVQECLRWPVFHGLDGELVVGEFTDTNVWNNTTSGIMSHRGQPPFTLWVFDYWDWAVPYQDRLEAMRSHPALQYNYIRYLSWTTVSSPAEVLAMESWALDRGFEGVILRSPAGRYKFGRSTRREQLCLKLKRFDDAEAVVIGAEELMHNMNEAVVNTQGHTERGHSRAGLVPAGTLGRLLVRDIKTGVEFGLGTGFTAEERAVLWGRRNSLLGSVVTYKYQRAGTKDGEPPRFPVWKGVRDKRDM